MQALISCSTGHTRSVTNDRVADPRKKKNAGIRFSQEYIRSSYALLVQSMAHASGGQVVIVTVTWFRGGHLCAEKSPVQCITRENGMVSGMIFDFDSNWKFEFSTQSIYRQIYLKNETRGAESRVAA